MSAASRDRQEVVSSWKKRGVHRVLLLITGIGPHATCRKAAYTHHGMSKKERLLLACGNEASLSLQDPCLTRPLGRGTIRSAGSFCHSNSGGPAKPSESMSLGFAVDVCRSCLVCAHHHRRSWLSRSVPKPSQCSTMRVSAEKRAKENLPETFRVVAQRR